MAFWDSFPGILYWGRGKLSERPARPENKNLGYWAWDTAQIFIAGNDREWHEIDPAAHVHDAGDITTWTLDAARIPSLPASIITSGVFSTAQIPNLSASFITSGVFSTARIPNLAGSIINSGTVGASFLGTMTGASVGANGASGAVPQPLIADRLKFLRGDGTWQVNSQAVSLLAFSNPGSNQASISFNPLSPTAGTLVIECLISSSHTTYDIFKMKVNNDGANHDFLMTGVSNANGAAAADVGIVNNFAGAATRFKWAHLTIKIWNAQGTTKSKEFESRGSVYDGGGGPAVFNILSKGSYVGTSAISRIDFLFGTGNILADSWIKVTQLADS